MERLRKHLQKYYEIPIDDVGCIQSELMKRLVEAGDWDPLDSFTVEEFDAQMNWINELLEGTYETWDPRTEPLLWRLVGTLERVCTFMEGDEWNDRYAAICQACSKMARSTFVSLSDLSSELPAGIASSAILEPGFQDEARVEEDLRYVTSYNGRVRRLTDEKRKAEAFEELIDRLRWFFNAVVLTRNQALLPIDRLMRLNRCLPTLVTLSDAGHSLTLEGCLHLEKLLVAIRQLMYLHTDYAALSKRETETLLRLFPQQSCPRFVYPRVDEAP